MPHNKTLNTVLMVFTFMMVFSGLMNAQTSVANDLKKRLSQAKDGPEKMDLLIELGDHIVYTNPDSALLLFDQVMTLSEKSDNQNYKAAALRKIGGVHNVKNDLQTAMQFYEKSLDLSEQLNDESAQAMALGSMASIHGRLGDNEKEIDVLKTVIETFKKLEKRFSEGEGHYRLAMAYRGIGKFDESLETAAKAEEILLTLDQNHKTQRMLADTYMAMAGNYGYTGDMARTSEYFLKARAIFAEIEDYSGLSNTLAMLGQVQMIQENYEKAIEYYLESIVMEKKLPNQIFLLNTYRSLGELYENIEEPDMAIRYFRLSVEFAERKQRKAYLAVSGSRLPFLYQQKGMEDSASYYYDKVLPQVEASTEVHTRGLAWENLGYYNFTAGNYQLAKDQLLKAYEYGKQYGMGVQMDVSNYLYRIYTELGDYQSALKYLEVNKMLSDSLFNAEQIRQITQMEADFEHDKEIMQKQGEIALLTAKEEAARLRLTLWVSGLVVLISIIVLVYRRTVRRKEQRARELEEIGQFKETMTSMIAHDLKNPLSMVLNSQSENRQTRQAAHQMLQLVNNMLDVHKFESASVKLNLQEFGLLALLHEIRGQINHLLAVRNLKLDLKVDVKQAIKADKEVLERVLVNLLTNAIKYAPVNSLITLSATARGEQVEIAVSDKGPGIPADKLEMIFESFGQTDARASGGVASTGLGLTFCKLALEAHGSQISVVSAPESGTTFSFYLDSGVARAEPVPAVMEVIEEPLVLMADEKLAHQVSLLRAMKLYEVGEIRRTLTSMRKQMTADKAQVDRWIDSVMNAAYEGNDQMYEQLLNRVVA